MIVWLGHRPCSGARQVDIGQLRSIFDRQLNYLWVHPLRVHGFSPFFLLMATRASRPPCNSYDWHASLGQQVAVTKQRRGLDRLGGRPERQFASNMAVFTRPKGPHLH